VRGSINHRFAEEEEVVGLERFGEVQVYKRRAFRRAAQRKKGVL